MNTTIDETQWIQASLPVSKGGLSYSTFVERVNGTLECIERRQSTRTSFDPKTLGFYQRRSYIISEKLNFDRLENEARFNASQEVESGGWLHLIPSSDLARGISPG